ncbi:MAG TPA: bifunctional phosphoribosylaminoimidazolecarboxamide formyltransferase/IMP cyclohydrolase [Gemmataceae bacterium]|nr:bifunctional phosphoribosylaminoimidazolecarboxamide formyltransferase/IMP cyclohydrolase [Gemmataceae bacterium]
MEIRVIRRALVSVFDKTGLIDLARGLARWNVELISTGGTRKALQEAGFSVRDISEITQFPEILDGRVKTLHPHIHAGILAVRGNPHHIAILAQQGIEPIDLVVCNLYPFEKTVASAASSHQEIIENIDIGGPSMIRAAAKNYFDLAVLTDPGQYGSFLEELHANQGGSTLPAREKLARAAFARTAAYDHAINDYFSRRLPAEDFPSNLNLHFDRRSRLRYGENPHQQAAFYVEPGDPAPSVATAEILHGKELSYNNLLDLDSALNLVREFADPTAVVIKHNNPCGAAFGPTLAEAFAKAWEGDPLSAFGGVLGFNRLVDQTTAMQITEPNRFIECIIAPGYAADAFHLLTTRPKWKENVRLLQTGPLGPSDLNSWDFRRVDGGLLLQSRDRGSNDFGQLKVVTRRAPTSAEMTDLRFAWLVCKHVKSNGIVLANDGMVMGVGAGQMSRVDSVHLAVRKAGVRVKGTVMASDAFFPFRDNIDEAAKVGVTAVIQPGGSMRDQDSIQACDENGLAMVFTGIRHFRH